MQFALVLFNVPVLQIALEYQKKQFDKKAIGFKQTRENNDGNTLYT